MMASLTEGVPAECMVGTFRSHGWIALAVTVAGLIGAIYSLCKGFGWLREEADSKRNGEKPSDRRQAKSWIFGFWVLAPPLWLYIEYIFLYRHFGKAACFGPFQYAQELVGRGWICLVAVLGALYFGKEIFGRE